MQRTSYRRPSHGRHGGSQAHSPRPRLMRWTSSQSCCLFMSRSISSCARHACECTHYTAATQFMRTWAACGFQIRIMLICRSICATATRQSLTGAPYKSSWTSAGLSLPSSSPPALGPRRVLKLRNEWPLLTPMAQHNAVPVCDSIRPSGHNSALYRLSLSLTHRPQDPSPSGAIPAPYGN